MTLITTNMNGAVELPGEANPLNLQTLYQVLTGASSADQQKVKTGTQQLHNWEKHSGYYSSLQVRSFSQGNQALRQALIVDSLSS